MKIFLICPVRNVTEAMKASIEAELFYLEKQGHTVHYPARDIDQNDVTGLRICRDNRMAIENADAVYVVWDGESQGCLFDLGMAFALRKKIVPVVGLFPAKTEGKSYQSMVHDWEERGA